MLLSHALYSIIHTSPWHMVLDDMDLKSKNTIGPQKTKKKERKKKEMKQERSMNCVEGMNVIPERRQFDACCKSA